MNRLGTIFKVAYNPQISQNLKDFIRLSVAPSLESDDTCQYNVDRIVSEIDGEYLNEDEQKFIELLVKNNIDYIEF